MDYQKTLYNNMRTHTPREHGKINRELQKNIRNKSRIDRFQSSRNISLSPNHLKKEIIIPICSDDGKSQEQKHSSSRVAKIICNANNPEKLTKQEAFLKSYIQWKGKKKNMKKPIGKKAFVVGVCNDTQTTTPGSFVPRGHTKEFRPPVLLKDRQEQQVDDNKKSITKARHSIYTVVPTPPRKPLDEKGVRKFPIARKALATNLHTKAMNTNKSQVNLKKVAVNKLSSTQSASKNAPVNSRTLEKSKTTVPTSVKQTVNKDLKPRAFKMPSPSASTSNPTVRKNLRPRALKMSSPHISTATKKPEQNDTKLKKSGYNVKGTKKSPFKSGGARLTQILKAKKTDTKKSNRSKLNIDSKKINLLKKDNKLGENLVVQTPRDFATSKNHFSEFVTSTKIKNSSENIEIDGISPIEPSPKKVHSSSSAKRNILLNEYNEQNENGNKDGPKNEKKFNFIRYSVPLDITVNKSTDNKVMQTTENDKKALSDEEKKINDYTPVIVEKTPPKSGSEERPANYLSPFVSVARGKVSLKKEKEKRNSIYLQNAAESNDVSCKGSDNQSPKYSVEVRRTLEAVRYFRKQLQDEIDRLHNLCNIWETYKKENIEKLQNANGEDMINVTIGQTRLLTSKKFMQFKSLIDRCESGATGIGAVEYDGSEDTKPITSVDLEGFWSMLGLQVDNLEKRFESLNRWKMNDWNDPDEVKPKKKNNLTKVKKVKARPVVKSKPSSALQQMLRKMQADLRKNSDKNGDKNEIVILTSNPKQRLSTSRDKSINTSESRRVSMIVKDRKYFSPAATVISYSSPNRKLSISHRKSSQDSPKIIKHIQKFNEALDTMQLSYPGLRKSVLVSENTRRMNSNPKSPVSDIDCKASQVSNNVNNKENEGNGLPQQSPNNSPMHPRKSILKTPGTARSRLRNVIFNEKLRVKKINFLINENVPFNSENVEDSNNTLEEDLSRSLEGKL